LAEITMRKCGRWNRHFSTRKRNAAREVAPVGDDSSAPEFADPHAPTPEDAATMVDLLDTLLRGLDERERLVCELRLQDYEVEEIATRTGWSQATVYRRLHRIKERLRRLCQTPDE
jgi:RNA polymerase sigma factor (sigma-70 family)